ncbi:MAG: hypothetical protein AAB460_03495 [Patescibacteria group bacterium]
MTKDYIFTSAKRSALWNAFNHKERAQSISLASQKVMRYTL